MADENKEEFKAQITEKFRDIELLCIKHKVPCFMTCALEENGATNYLHTTITPNLVGVKLTDNKIDKFNAALNSHITMHLNTKGPASYIGDIFEGIVGEDETDNAD